MVMELVVLPLSLAGLESVLLVLFPGAARFGVLAGVRVGWPTVLMVIMLITVTIIIVVTVVTVW